MDKFINEPLEVYSKSEANFRPYLNQHNRELFYRTNYEELYNKLFSIQQRFTINPVSDPRFVVHVPFDQKEHETVLQYLLLTKYYNMHDPVHALPFQIMETLNYPEMKKNCISRSSESILQYLSEIYIRQSTLFNAEDQTIFLTSSPRIFPNREVNHKFSLTASIHSKGMNSDRSKLLKIEDILPSSVVIFITDVSPIVVDLSVGINSRNTNPLKIYEPCFLMSSSSRFLINGPPEFCSDKHRFCCFYERGTLNFIDLSHRVKFRNKGREIPSFKCWPYPCYESLTLLCACCDPLDKSTMIIAAKTDNGTISTWTFNSSDHTVSRSSFDIKPIRIEWIPGQQLAVVTKNQNVSILRFPWDGQRTDDETVINEFSMDVPHRFVECQGDAYVLEQVIDSSVVSEIETVEPDLSSSSNISENEEKESNGKFEVPFADHRIAVCTFDDDQFEIIVDQPIQTCAYLRGNFAMSTLDGRIFVFDKKVRYARTCLVESFKINFMVPVDFAVGQPLFARVSRSSLSFFDNHGNTSKEWPIENAAENGVFFHRYGFCVTLSDKFEMGIKWFY